MSEQNNSELEFSSLTINQQKLALFLDWCQENQINAKDILEKFINACLEDNEIIKSLLIDTNNVLTLEQKIQFYLDKSLQPLIKRIEQLEAQNNQSYPTENMSSLSSLVTSTINETFELKNVELDESKITYLPRNKVWQRLKKTDYVKYSGYDNFLKAKGDEFIEYGIFFDSNKKRYYIFNEDQ